MVPPAPNPQSATEKWLAEQEPQWQAAFVLEVSAPFEKAVDPLTERAWSLLMDKQRGIFKYWVDYARLHPEHVGAEGA